MFSAPIVAMNKDEEEAQEVERLRLQQKGNVACPACTFINKSGARACEVCGS